MEFEQFLPDFKPTHNDSSIVDDEIDWVIGYAGETLANFDSDRVETVVRTATQAVARLATPEVVDIIAPEVTQLPLQLTKTLSTELPAQFQSLASLASSLPEAAQIQAVLRDPEMPTLVVEQVSRAAGVLYQQAVPVVEHLQAQTPAVSAFVQENAPAVTAFVRENAPIVEQFVRANAPAVTTFVAENAPAVEKLVRENAPAVQDFVHENAPAVAAFVRENAPMVEQFVRANAPAVTTFVAENAPAVEKLVRENAPAVQDFVRENAPAIVAFVKNNAPAVEHFVRSNAPAITAFVVQNAPVVEKIVRESAPVVAKLVRENSPVVEQFVRQNAPVVVAFAKENAPLVERYVRETAPVVAKIVRETLPQVEQLVRQNAPVSKDALVTLPITAGKEKVVQLIDATVRETLSRPLPTSLREIAIAKEIVSTPLALRVLDLTKSAPSTRLSARIADFSPSAQKSDFAIRTTPFIEKKVIDPKALTPFAERKVPAPSAEQKPPAHSVEQKVLAPFAEQKETTRFIEQKQLSPSFETRESATVMRMPTIEIARFPFAVSKLEPLSPETVSAVLVPKVLHSDTVTISIRPQHMEVDTVTLKPKRADLEGISIKPTQAQLDVVVSKPYNLTIVKTDKTAAVKIGVVAFKPPIAKTGQVSVNSPNVEYVSTKVSEPRAEASKVPEIPKQVEISLGLQTSKIVEVFKIFEPSKCVETPRRAESVLPEANRIESTRIYATPNEATRIETIRTVKQAQESVRHGDGSKSIEIVGQRIPVLRTIVRGGFTAGAAQPDISQESTGSLKVRVTPGELKDKENLLPKIWRRRHFKSRRGDKRYLTGIEIALAGACLVASIAKSQQPAGSEEANSSPQLPVTLFRAKHMVGMHDSLTNLAEEKYGDKRYAWLLLELNSGAVGQEQRDNQLVVRLKERQEIELPTSKDLQEFRAKLSQVSEMRIITVVESSSFSRELLNLHLGAVIGA